MTCISCNSYGGRHRKWSQSSNHQPLTLIGRSIFGAVGGGGGVTGPLTQPVKRTCCADPPAASDEADLVRAPTAHDRGLTIYR